MPKEVVLEWDEYLKLCDGANKYYEIFNASSPALKLHINNLINENNAKAYLMPILRILERSTNIDAN